LSRRDPCKKRPDDDRYDPAHGSALLCLQFNVGAQRELQRRRLTDCLCAAFAAAPRQGEIGERWFSGWSGMTSLRVAIPLRPLDEHDLFRKVVPTLRDHA
jgi:hypothetical protein